MSIDIAAGSFSNVEEMEIIETYLCYDVLDVRLILHVEHIIIQIG